MPPRFHEPELLARDGALVVLLKPAGLPVHATGRPGPDLVGWAREQLGLAGLAPVHRLDLEASGPVLCATEPRLRAELAALFAEARVEKRYLALVHGRTHLKGVIRRPLSDGRRGHPLAAVTRYRRLRVYGAASHLLVRPETGRHHQIRRHLQGIGHAVVGDDRYPTPRFKPVPAFPGRLWLHCAEIALPDGRRFAAELPEELRRHLELLEQLRTTG